MYQAIGDPFSSPILILWDGLRIYCSLVSVLVMVGMMVQVFDPQPDLRPGLQKARVIFIAGTMFVLLGEVVTNMSRLGFEPSPPIRLICATLGATILIAWLWTESRARREGHDDR
jgi:hypothetical protein